MSLINFDVDLSKQELKEQYVTSISTLETVRDAPSLTQEQAIQAVQYMARVLIWILKFLKNYHIR